MRYVKRNPVGHSCHDGTVTYRGAFVTSLDIDRGNVAELAETLWRQARHRLGTRFRLFEHLRTLAEYQVFPSWTALMTLLATGGPAAQPP